MTAELAATDIDWGSVPGWIALVGALVAAISFVVGRRDAVRRYASQVFPIVEFNFGSPPKDEHHTTVTVQNRSDAPVFECTVALFDWGWRRRWWRFLPQEKWMTGRRIVGRRYATLLAQSAPKDPAELPGLRLPVLPKGQTSLDYLTPPVVVVFTDGNGRRWVRWPDGRLSRTRRLRRRRATSAPDADRRSP